MLAGKFPSRRSSSRRQRQFKPQKRSQKLRFFIESAHELEPVGKERMSTVHCIGLFLRRGDCFSSAAATFTGAGGVLARMPTIFCVDDANTVIIQQAATITASKTRCTFAAFPIKYTPSIRLSRAPAEVATNHIIIAYFYQSIPNYHLAQ